MRRRWRWGRGSGIVAVTALIAQVSISVYTASLAGKPQAQVDALTTTFQGVLTALGTPSFQAISQAVQPGDLVEYRIAYFAGVQVALLAAGGIALVGGVIAWLTLGRRNPLQTVYEHRDERVPVAAG